MTTETPSKGQETLFTSEDGKLVQLLWTSTNEVAEITPQGGGFVRKMPREEFDRRFKPAPLPQYRLADISAEWLDPSVKLKAYTNGYRWNGWATPHFTLEQAAEVQKHMPGLQYDAEKDAFVFPDENEDEPWVFESETIIVDGQDIKVYGIGSGSWCWTLED